jgi:hypothetical protein
MQSITLTRERIQEEEAEVEITDEQIIAAGFDPEGDLSPDDIYDIVNVDNLLWSDNGGWERIDDSLKITDVRYYSE